MTARRRLAAILAGAVVAGVGGCRSGAPELDVATVRELLLRPGTIPPLPPVGVMPNRIKDVGAACPYLMAGQGDAPVVRRDVCRHLAFFETPGGVRLAALRDPIPRQLVELSPIERPSPDVRIARFTVRWTTEAIDETVRGCFRWVEGAAQARFARVDGKWQLSGFDEVVDRRTEVPCPADGPL